MEPQKKGIVMWHQRKHHDERWSPVGVRAWVLRSALCSVWVLLACTPGWSAAPASAGTTFKVRLENVSTPTTLKMSNGKASPVLLAPGVWVVHTGANPLLVPGKPDPGHGLKALAEDGDPNPLVQWLAQQHGKGVSSSGSFHTPTGEKQPGLLKPGQAYEFTVQVTPSDKLSFAAMFAESNDLFYALAEDGLALFDAQGQPLSGDMTSRVALWDAGTEVNQEPGLGSDQAHLQKAPKTGKAENGAVRLVADSFTYPPVREVIRVLITPQTTAR